jgi:exosortase K
MTLAAAEQIDAGAHYSLRAGVRIARDWFRAGGLVSLFMLASAFGLKLAYSNAGASELEWVLGPSCLLARIAGIPLAQEAGAGWISHAPRMVVGAACAGVNFLVVCWLALYFSVQQHWAGHRRKLGLWVATLLGAYVATVSTNGLRIVLAARLYDMHIYAGYFTAARMHRGLGVVLYCSTLFGLCRAAELWTLRAKPTAAGAVRRRPSLAPFLWYLAVAIGVPLANRAFVRGPGQFVEHSAMTLGLGLGVVVAFRVFGRLADRLSSRRAAS